jgi:hypothetical protein
MLRIMQLGYRVSLYYYVPQDLRLFYRYIISGHLKYIRQSNMASTGHCNPRKGAKYALKDKGS